MARAKWKGPYISSEPFKNFNEVKKNHNISIIPRNCEIVPKFVGLPFRVHNGKNYAEVLVINEMVGHKFGEFTMTRARFSFKKKKLKK